MLPTLGKLSWTRVHQGPASRFSNSCLSQFKDGLVRMADAESDDPPEGQVSSASQLLGHALLGRQQINCGLAAIRLGDVSGGTCAGVIERTCLRQNPAWRNQTAPWVKTRSPALHRDTLD